MVEHLVPYQKKHDPKKKEEKLTKILRLKTSWKFIVDFEKNALILHVKSVCLHEE